MSQKKGLPVWLVILLHVLAWSALFALPTLLAPEKSTEDPIVMERNKEAMRNLGRMMFVFWIGFFYLHAFVLIPRLAYRKKPGLYLLSLAGVMVVLLGIHKIYFGHFTPDDLFNPRNFLVFNTVPLFFFMLASGAFRLALDRYRAEKLERERQNENLKTELSLLRSQVSPHFMFNVLNNMVSLARKKSDLLEPSLIKLSQLLRYMLYETDEKVPLNREVEYLQSYIDLQSQRFGQQVKILADINVHDEGLEIEPMLLIPFVENAFKHGVAMIEDPEIRIRLGVERDQLGLEVHNRFVEGHVEEKDKSSGIGLVNVRRRLQLLYPGKHQLDIHDSDGWFHVSLKIDLS